MRLLQQITGKLERQDMKQREKDLEFIIEHYGYDCQSRQLIEEMAELTQAINKVWRAEKGYIEKTDKQLSNMAEEIADVEICLEQIKLHFGVTFSDQVEQYKNFKINRALERIDKQKNKQAEALT